MKLNKKTVGGFFLIVLILLIFCSKTIYAHNLPEVTAVKPQNGRLSKLEITSGVAEWAEIEHIYAPLDGTVAELPVREGDTVEAGEVLLRLEFDRDEAERKLRELASNREQLRLELQNIQLRLQKAERNLSAAGYGLDSLQREIDQAQTALADAEILYQLGEISQRELEAAQDTLTALSLKREKTATDYQADVASLQLELQAKNLELLNLTLQEEPYRKALADYETYAVITAPASGQLLTLNAQKGERVNENTLLFSIGAGQEFVVECIVSLQNNFVLPGDSCELSNSSHVIKGTVSRVNPGERGKTVSVTLVSSEVTAGETFDVVFEKESDTTYTLVPNGAINQDNDGYFLNQVKRRDGILGKEYYLERLNVYIGDADDKNTAIIRGVTFFEPVALISDKPVNAGDVVKLSNVGEFFED